MINCSDVTFVLQGAVSKDTDFVIKSIRDNFPLSIIILSTWKDSDTRGLDYDTLVTSDDPGGIIVDDKAMLLNNINRQIVSTFEGIKRVTTKYVVKARTDIVFKSNKILHYLDRYNKTGGQYNLLQHRILVLSDTSNNPHRDYKMPFHICDFIYAGLTQDVYDIFDIDLMPKEYFRWFETKSIPNNANYPTMLSRYMPETYIWYSFLSKKLQIKFDHTYDTSNNNIELSETIISDVLIMVSSFQIGVKCLKYPNQFFATYQKYTFYEWKKLYNNQKLTYFSFFDIEFLFLYSISKIKNIIKTILGIKN